MFTVLQTLKHLLKAVTLENLISHRSLLHEGKLVLTGARGQRNCHTFDKLCDLKVWKSLTTLFVSVHSQRTQS